jgi:glycerate kinase
MTAAAGAISGALWAAHGATLEAGAPFVLDTLDFDTRMRASRAVVTGEGKLDEQTLAGKAAGEVAVRCRQAGVACHAIVGRDDLDDFSVRILALDSLAEAGDPATLEAAAARLA